MAAEESRITVRLGRGQLDKLDRLAAAADCSRSLLLRRLIDAADGSTPPGLGPDDLLGLMEEKARAGSAPAIRYLLNRRETDERWPGSTASPGLTDD